MEFILRVTENEQKRFVYTDIGWYLVMVGISLGMPRLQAGQHSFRLSVHSLGTD